MRSFSGRAVRALVSLSVVLSFSAALAAPGLEVLVLDEMTGEEIAGIGLTLRNEARGSRELAITNEQGRARFAGLSTAGEYVVSAEGGSLFEDFTSDPIRLRTNRVESLTVTLSPVIASEEAVEVRGGTRVARINTIDAEVSATLLPQELRDLPVEGRDVTRALYRLPNVTQATGFYPEAPNVSINGANGLYANYLIDGLDNNENFLGGQKFPVPLGFAQDVTVLTSSYSVEFGRTGNGVFNVTSRSGSNELSGEIYSLVRPGEPWDASSSFASRDLAGNAVRDGFSRLQAGVGVGGPIVEDKTFFFVNYEWTRDEKDNLLDAQGLGVRETVEGDNDFDLFSTKLDHIWNERWRSSLRVNVGDVEIERQGGAVGGGDTTFASAGSVQKRDSLHVALQTLYTGDGFLSETSLAYGAFDWTYVDPLGGAGPRTVVFGETDAGDPDTSLVLGALGHPGFTFANEEETVHLKQRFTTFVGDHAIKLGGEVIRSDFTLRAGGNPRGNYFVSLDDDQIASLPDAGADLAPADLPPDTNVLRYDVELRASSFGEDQEIYALFAEDVWSVTPRLNLTFGVRYDYDSLSKGGSDSGDDDNFAPRFSLNWQPDANSAVRFGAGLFYDKILYAIYSDALQQNTDSAAYRAQIAELVDRGLLPADTNVDRVTFPGNVVASFAGATAPAYLEGETGPELADRRDEVVSFERRILNPDGYDNPVTTQFTLGYQRQLRRDILIAGDLIYAETHNLPRLVNLNAPAPFFSTPSDPVRTPEEANATRPLGTPDPGEALNIVMTEMEGESEYRAATVTLLKDRSDDWYSFRLSYTLSKLENDTDDINFRASNSNLFANEWGPSLNDRRHVFNGFLRVFPTDNLTISLAALIQSGQPVNRIPDVETFGTTDLDGDGLFFGDAYLGNSDRYPGESRNSDRLPWSRVFDLGISYAFPLPTGRLELRVDAFNVFNNEVLSGFSNNATQSNQIQQGPPSFGIVKRSEAPRRQIQLGARYVF